MRLVEISFGANVPFEWVKQGPEHNRADFESQGRRYFVDFYTGNWDGTPCWMFQFGIYQPDKEASTMRMTKLKNPYSVLSTVKAVFDDFMQRKHPACLAFYDGDRIPSRMRWYGMFARYVAERYGYRQDDEMMQKAMRTLTRSPDTFIWILKRGRQDEASGQRIPLNFDTLYGKAFKITDPEGDPSRQGFSIISRIANGSVWDEWQERPQFKAMVRQRMNDPGFLADYKYQQIVDSAQQLGLLDRTLVEDELADLETSYKRLKAKRDQLNRDTDDLPYPKTDLDPHATRSIRQVLVPDEATYQRKRRYRALMRDQMTSRIIEMNHEIALLRARIRAAKRKGTPEELFVSYDSQKTKYERSYLHEIGQMIDQADGFLPYPAADAITRFVGHAYSKSPEGGAPGFMAEEQLEDAYSAHPSEKGVEIRQQLDAAFAPIRDALRQQFGDTVTIHRAQSPLTGTERARNVLSWTSNLKFAESLLDTGRVLRDLLTKTVAIEDIVWITDRANQSEFIVRNRQTLGEARIMKTYRVAWGRNQYAHLGTETVKASSERDARRQVRQSLEDRFFGHHGMKILYVVEIDADQTLTESAGEPLRLRVQRWADEFLKHRMLGEGAAA